MTLQPTKYQLTMLLFTKLPHPLHFTDSRGGKHFGRLQTIQREDGSGSSFNLTVSNEHGSDTFHVRTVD